MTVLTPNDRWGPWQFQAHGLKNIPADYVIHWSRVDSVLEAFDWILQLSGKNPEVYGDDQVRHLIDAFAEVLGIRSGGLRDAIGSGQNMAIDGAALAAAHRERLRAAGMWPSRRSGGAAPPTPTASAGVRA